MAPMFQTVRAPGIEIGGQDEQPASAILVLPRPATAASISGVTCFSIVLPSGPGVGQSLSGVVATDSKMSVAEMVV